MPELLLILVGAVPKCACDPGEGAHLTVYCRLAMSAGSPKRSYTNLGGADSRIAWSFPIARW
jgi:hypothetical protein